MNNQSPTYHDKLNYIADNFSKTCSQADMEMEHDPDTEYYSGRQSNQRDSVETLLEYQTRDVEHDTSGKDLTNARQSINSNMGADFDTYDQNLDNNNLLIDNNVQDDVQQFDNSQYQYDQVDLTKSGNRIDSLTPRSVSFGERDLARHNQVDNGCSIEDNVHEDDDASSSSSDDEEGDIDINFEHLDIHGKGINQTHDETSEELLPFSDHITEKNIKTKSEML